MTIRNALARSGDGDRTGVPCTPHSSDSRPQDENALFLRYLNELRDRAEGKNSIPPLAMRRVGRHRLNVSARLHQEDEPKKCRPKTGERISRSSAAPPEVRDDLSPSSPTSIPNANQEATNMNIHANVTPMNTVLALLQQERPIEAIKAFREAYGTGLKEAKDAIETIRDAFVPRVSGPTEYLVISRYEDGDDYQVVHADGKDEAMRDANRIVDSRVEVVVASIIARSVTTRAMKEVA
jgi:hypothetical protein